ncbi:Cysteine and glycine-rich protein 1 [Chytriomyces hyalinus]|nr:Cysteine and glycine-rich protein 1 [Chytriomyces hyalinus]
MPPKFGGAPSCVRCSKSVYMAEQIAGPGGMWHKTCLNCKECNRKLDSTNLTERNNEAFCKTCYAKLYGPKGYGYGGNMLNTDTTITNEQRFFSATDSNTTLSNAAVSALPANVFATPQSQPAVVSATTPLAPTNQFAAKAMFEEKAKLFTPSTLAGGCPRCGKQVYFAEQILGPGGIKYHKLCFRCTDCGKGLDSTTMAENNSVLFCKTCHGKKFGPKGYGYGVGAGTLANTQ